MRHRSSAFHPSYRPAVGDWKNRVAQRAAGIRSEWAEAMLLAEEELQQEGKRFALIGEVQNRAREIIARKEERV